MSQLIATGMRRSRSGDSCGDETPITLPTVLDPFAEGAAPAVMTRIALDWMIEGTSIEPILDEVSEGQYTREFLLGHFVQVMCDVACGFRKSPRAAFLKRQLDLVASISAFYRKLGRMEPAVPAAIVRETAGRARELISAAGGLLPEPIPGYAARSSMATSSQGPTIASLSCARLVRRPCRACRWPSTSRSAAWFST